MSKVACHIGIVQPALVTVYQKLGSQTREGAAGTKALRGDGKGQKEHRAKYDTTHIGVPVRFVHKKSLFHIVITGDILL